MAFRIGIAVDAAFEIAQEEIAAIAADDGIFPPPPGASTT
jgi:hypothetical protein